MRNAAMPLLLAAALLGSPAAAADEEEAAAAWTPPRYMIIRADLPAQTGGPHAGVSRGSFIVNFGSREGVLPGSILNVRRERLLVGVVRVDRVWRDSASVSILSLTRKDRADAPSPLLRGFYLEPKFVFLQSIQFASGQPAIDPDMHERLHYASRFIRAYPDFPLIIEGHTDAVGKAAANAELARRRADRIRTFLHEVHRLPAEQMHVKAYGETDPIASNATAAGRALNRRVDIILADVVPE